MKQVLLDLTFQLIIDDFLPFLGKFFGPYDQIFRNQQNTNLNSGKISVILYFYRIVDILQLGLILVDTQKGVSTHKSGHSTIIQEIATSIFVNIGNMQRQKKASDIDIPKPTYPKRQSKTPPLIYKVLKQK